MLCDNMATMKKRKQLQLPVYEVLNILFCLFCVAVLVVEAGKNTISYRNTLYIVCVILAYVLFADFYRFEKKIGKDSLSKLPNDQTFFSYCTYLQLSGELKKYSAAFVNIKGFKYINTKYGAPVGDDVIKEYSKIMKSNLSKGEIIARLGGDNFIVLYKKEREKDILNLLSGVPVVVNIDGNLTTIVIAARCGVYDIQNKDNVSIVMNSTTIACNVARRTKTADVVRFVPSMLESIINSKKIVSQFDSALKAEEFVVYYQPKVDIATNKTIGAEALVRWNKDGMLALPEEFISILEVEGLIQKLDYYVLRKVCNDLKSWKAFGLTPVKISTNFSRLNIKSPDFAANVINIVKECGVDPSLIEIELTESIGYEDVEILCEAVESLHRYGISVSIDDFGTGYSSLSLIKNLKADMIKLDKSFLVDVSNECSTNYALIKNLVLLINDLGSNVICEGVETKLQAELLLSAGCKTAQGYLYSMPVCENSFKERLYG